MLDNITTYVENVLAATDDVNEKFDEMGKFILENYVAPESYENAIAMLRSPKQTIEDTDEGEKLVWAVKSCLRNRHDLELGKITTFQELTKLLDPVVKGTL